MSLAEHSMTDERLIELGEVKAVYGIKGWVKVFSYSRPIEQIFNYSHWLLGQPGNWQRVELEDSNQRANSGLVAKFKGIDERSTAELLIGKTIAVESAELAELNDGEYYWSQLIGLSVINTEQQPLGVVKELLETGANDVLVVEHESAQQLIPYAPSVVLKVDLVQSQLVVDWQSGYWQDDED